MGFPNAFFGYFFVFSYLTKIKYCFSVFHLLVTYLYYTFRLKDHLPKLSNPLKGRSNHFKDPSDLSIKSLKTLYSKLSLLSDLFRLLASVKTHRDTNPAVLSFSHSSNLNSSHNEWGHVTLQHGPALFMICKNWRYAWQWLIAWWQSRLNSVLLSSEVLLQATHVQTQVHTLWPFSLTVRFGSKKLL